MSDLALALTKSLAKLFKSSALSDLISLLAISIFICLLVTRHSQAAELNPQQILAASDAVRNPDFGFSLTNQLSEYRQGQLVDTSHLQVYAKADSKTAQFRNLVRYLSPARDQNKLILMNGKEMWFYDPASKASIRLSPQQRLLGQASNGDVVTVNLARDYLAQSAREELILDGDKQNRQCYLLELQAQNEAASYPRIQLWVEQKSFKPLKARFYSASDKLLKTAFYRRYQLALGSERPTETIIIDGLDNSWVTLMRYSEWRKTEIPESWLQREYLSSFRPD